MPPKPQRGPQAGVVHGDRGPGYGRGVFPVWGVPGRQQVALDLRFLLSRCSVSLGAQRFDLCQSLVVAGLVGSSNQGLDLLDASGHLRGPGRCSRKLPVLSDILFIGEGRGEGIVIGGRLSSREDGCKRVGCDAVWELCLRGSRGRDVMRHERGGRVD